MTPVEAAVLAPDDDGPKSVMCMRATFGPGRYVFYDVCEDPNMGYVLAVTASDQEVPSADTTGTIISQFDPTLPLTAVIATLMSLARSEVVAYNQEVHEFLAKAFDPVDAEGNAADTL